MRGRRTRRRRGRGGDGVACSWRVVCLLAREVENASIQRVGATLRCPTTPCTSAGRRLVALTTKYFCIAPRLDPTFTGLRGAKRSKESRAMNDSDPAGKISREVMRVLAS